MGATHVVNPMEGDPVAAIQRICAGGLDIAVEATGRPPVMRQALECVRSQGGVAVVIGNAREGETLVLDPRQLNQGKQLRGTWGGDNWPDTDFARYARLLECGKLNVQPLLSSPFQLEQINEALEALEKGAVGRPLIEMSQR
jgi:S-(hydroxymethyl)glutathione dehydrogenase/alcohol dehydrogenase